MYLMLNTEQFPKCCTYTQNEIIKKSNKHVILIMYIYDKPLDVLNFVIINSWLLNAS